MPVAQVVPLRRLPSHRSLFDYDIPDSLEARPGQLVTVPFLRSHVLAVVWNILEHSDVKGRKPIDSIVMTDEVVTVWQRSVAERIQAQTFASLGHILDGVIPKYSSRKEKTILDSAVKEKRTYNEKGWPQDKTWWYRSRQQAETWLFDWLTAQDEPAVVVMPTIEESERLAERLAKDGVLIGVAHSKLGQVAYRHLYEHVRLKKIHRVIGSASALLLPFPSPPKVIIDQEEHPSHKAVLQHPRFDLRLVVDQAQALSAVTTPAPSLWWWNKVQPVVPTVPSNQRVLASLQEPTEDFWITSAASEALDDAAEHKKRAAIIAPRRGYAGAVRCRTCGQGLDCPVCHHPASLQGRPSEPLRCQYCGQMSQLPTTCPHCQGVNWQFAGLGPEKIADIIGRRWSFSVVHAGQGNDTTTTALIGTYQLYRQLQRSDISAIIVAHADALINIPDFSAEERAWQYLARIEAAAPNATIIVQSFRPEHDFWQRWQRRDDATWYSHEINLRNRLHLPPIADQWIARIPASSTAKQAVQKKLSELKTAFPQLEVAILPERKKLRQQSPRLLVTSKIGALSSLLNGPEIFPTPWQVETAVSSWLD